VNSDARGPGENESQSQANQILNRKLGHIDRMFTRQ
jgi:hypothetical protein